MPRRVVSITIEEYVTDMSVISKYQKNSLEYDQYFITDGTIARFDRAKALFEALNDFIQEKRAIEELKEEEQ